MDPKMIQLFEISEWFQNKALGNIFSLNDLIIIVYFTRVQYEHYEDRVVNCLIFVLPVEEYFWIHIEHCGGELIEVFHRIVIADHYFSKNARKTFDESSCDMGRIGMLNFQPLWQKINPTQTDLALI